MASKRIAQSSVNWTALAERVPPQQKTNFIAFKSRADKYLRAVLANPDQSPKIDWAAYKNRVPAAGLVDTFQKAYEALKIPYPADTLSSEVDKLRVEVKKDIEQFKKESEVRISKSQAEIERIKSLLPYAQMTLEDFRDAHPDLALDPLNKPTLWPHTADAQPDYVDPNEKKEGGH